MRERTSGITGPLDDVVFGDLAEAGCDVADEAGCGVFGHEPVEGAGFLQVVADTLVRAMGAGGAVGGEGAVKGLVALGAAYG